MRRAGQVWQAGVVGVLCGVMVVPPAAMAEGVGSLPGSASGSLPAERHDKPLTQDERVVMALDRFTFGPRPGDVAAVERMGLQRWFEMQLHPERIDDSGFGEELLQYPAVGLPVEEEMRRFPSGAMIRQMSNRGDSVPSDPVEGAIYRDAEAVYEARVENKAAKGQGVVDPTHPQGARMDGAPFGVGAQEVSDPTHPQSARMDGAPGVVGAQEVSDPTHPQGARMDGAPMISGAEVEAVLRLGPEERLGRLVAMSPEEMLGFREVVKGRDRVRLVEGMSPAQREAVEAMVESPERVIVTEDQELRLMRDIDSKRQLQAVMTEFWLNHFNVYLHKNEQEPYFLAEYEEDAILPHALGRFEDLLDAVAESPAMEMYLDNWESIGPDSPAAGRVAKVQKARPNGKVVQKLPKGINENYGRELMELHTLGVNGGYTQQDVIEVAKCFTGWTVDRPYAGGGRAKGMGGGMMQGAGGMMMEAEQPGEFVFQPNRHEPGAKVVLGHTIPEGGMKEGLEVLHILATSPATAHFLSQELAVRFVSDNPPAALVNAMAAAYLKTDGDIAAVMETMFRSKLFWAPGVYRAKVKTPLEFLTSAVRASDATVTNPMPLVQAMDRLGMPVWGMQTPNGYGWTAEDWVSTNGLLARMNFALVLSGNRVPGVRTDWAAMVGGTGAADAATERVLEGRVLDEAASERTRAAVMAESANPAAQAQAEAGFRGEAAGGARMVRARAPAKGAEMPLDTMAGLLIGSPEFQRR